MESHHIILNNQLIEYDIIFKQMKSIYLRVKQGRLVISAPYHTPISLIEDNIRKYQHKLLIQIESYESYAVYQDGGYVDIFNQRYEIRLRHVERKLCEIHEPYLYVYHQKIEPCVKAYLRQILKNYVEERVIHYLAYDFDLDMPDIEIKAYKGRWGSCFYRENKMTFNLALVHLEKDLIDYVIVHELSHFLQANHSALFYQEVAKRMPDYKDRQKRLKEKHI